MRQYSLYLEFAARACNLLENLVEQDGIQLYNVSERQKPGGFPRMYEALAEGVPSSLSEIADLAPSRFLSISQRM